MNAAFLSMAAGAGMTSAIMNPLHAEEMTAIMGANVMNGVDPECRRWIAKFREAPAEGEGRGGKSSPSWLIPQAACQSLSSIAVVTGYAS